MTVPLGQRLAVTNEAFLAERPPGADEDVHMLATVVDHVISRCSRRGDVVLDPFAGFGTTLERSAALGRRAFGLELLPERVEYVRHRTPRAEIWEGDARELERIVRRAAPELGSDGIDLILTSPPYMTEYGHSADPLTAYEGEGGNYRRYLDELRLVAVQCARLIRPGGFVVWNVADIHFEDHVTPLIRDCARVLAQFLIPVGVTEIAWDQYPHDLVRDALLMFQRGD